MNKGRLTRLSVLALLLLAIAAGVGGCSKCDVAGLLKGCGGAVPKG